MSRARLFFHIALGGIFVPGLGLPAALTLALIAAYDRRVPEAERASHRRWTRALFGLFTLDVVLVLLLVSVLGGMPQQPVAVGSAAPRVTLGVRIEAGSTPPRLEEAVAGGAAAAAGLRAGDVVRRVDEQQVSTLAELRARLAEHSPGDTVQVEVEREGDLLSVAVPLGAHVTRGLFEPDPGSTCAPGGGPLRRGFIFPLIGALAVFGLYAWGRRRGMDATVLWAALLLVGVSAGASGASLLTCTLIGGQAAGTFLVGVLAQTVLLIAGGLWLWRRARRKGWGHRAERSPTLPWPHAVGLGVLYGLTGALRVGICVLVFTALTQDAAPAPFGDSPLHALAQGPLGPLGWALFILPVVVLGPMGEELLFRGAVLPWLAGFLPKVAALVISASLFAVLHLYYGAFVLLILWYGVVLGWARLASGGLKAPIALHVVMNGTAALVMLLRGG